MSACTKHIPEPEHEAQTTPRSQSSDTYLSGDYKATSFVSYCSVDLVNSMEILLDVGTVDLAGVYPVAPVTMYQETDGVTQTTKGYFQWENGQLRWQIAGETVGLYNNPNSGNLAFAASGCEYQYSRISLISISE